jgi:hypothetical protein
MFLPKENPNPKGPRVFCKDSTAGAFPVFRYQVFFLTPTLHKPP